MQAIFNTMLCKFSPLWLNRKIRYKRCVFHQI